MSNVDSERKKRWGDAHPNRRKEITKKYLDNGGSERKMMRRVGHTYLPNGETKRPFLGFCEVCGVPIGGEGEGHRNYHHWEDDMLAMGIWLCNGCHRMAEGADKGLTDIYLKERAEIEKAYALKQLRKLVELGIVSEMDILTLDREK